MVFANDQDNTVYMYEKTTEVSKGFSFGASNDSWSQSGKTLFRKVKSIQYGLDGKAYEYTLDLGAIPKTIKEIAQKYGWKFKTVINKNKALYPAGYSPNVAQPINPGQNYIPNNQATSNEKVNSNNHYNAPPPYEEPLPDKKGNLKKILGIISFGLLGLFLLLMLFGGNATPVGWAVCLGIFSVAFFLHKKFQNKGCLTHIILWVVASFILLIALVTFTKNDVNFTTAKIINSKMTTSVDSTGKPTDTVTSYSINAPELVASAELRNAPTNTKVKFIWKYVPQDLTITEFELDSGDNDPNIYVFSHITNDKPWPEGEYKVEIYIEDREEPDQTINFTVSP